MTNENNCLISNIPTIWVVWLEMMQLYTYSYIQAPTEKAAFRRIRHFHQQLDFNLGETYRNATFGTGSLWCWKLDTMKSRSEIPEKFWDVVLEKDGED